MDSQSFFNAIIIIVGIIFAIAQWRNGRNKSAIDALSQANGTIDLLTKRADAFGNELEEMKKMHHDNELKIAKLEESNKHKDQLIDQYFAIITNRNPKLEETLLQVRDFLEVLTKNIAAATVAATTLPTGTKVTVETPK